MFISACLCIGIGIYPAALYSLLPYDTGYNPYDATHVLAQTQLLLFSALAFVWLNLKGKYPPELRSTHLDIDWVYRRLVPNGLQRIFAVIWKVDAEIRQSIRSKLNQCQTFLSRQYKGGGSLMSTDYPSGNMVLWVAVILATYLFIGFVS